LSGRREKRIEATLAVHLEQGSGVTRNVSASGVYFETDVPLAEGAPIHFSIDFSDSAGGPVRMKCEARIVRVERKNGKVGVGAAITAFKLERPRCSGAQIG
jgi:hypothetical protein